MVKQILSIFVLLPALLCSADFTASVNRNQIGVGENFTYTLMLKDANAKTNPSLEPLRRTFTISSQQQMFNTVMINGKVTSTATWKYTLAPQKEGDIIIPAIIIETSEGLLATEPITIQVVKGSTTAVREPETQDLILTKDVSNAFPYKNEPFLFTIRLLAKKEVRDIQIPKITLENAIIEQTQDPVAYKKLVDGDLANIIEFEYLITPLKAGPLKIPSTQIKGVVSSGRKEPISLFDDDFDLFSMMPGFDKFKPFSLETDDTTLEIQPAVAGMTTWLPARSLRVEEVWDDTQTLKEGEPFVRGFRIYAEGIKSNQIPSLEELQKGPFKIYADKPELQEEIKDGKLKSSRREQYTIIPQESGFLTLPEFAVTWWDVIKKEKTVTRVPARTIQIHSSPKNNNKQDTEKPIENLIVTSSQDASKSDIIFYAVIGSLAMLLCGAVFWVIALQRKITRFKDKSVASKSVVRKRKRSHEDKNEKLPDLNPT